VSNERDALLEGLDRGDRELRPCDREDDRGQAGTRSDVEDAPAREKGHHGERVQKVLVDDCLGVRDGGQVDLSVPLEQERNVPVERADLLVRQPDTDQRRAALESGSTVGGQHGAQYSVSMHGSRWLHPIAPEDRA
jgi:hypothetical protein